MINRIWGLKLAMLDFICIDSVELFGTGRVLGSKKKKKKKKNQNQNIYEGHSETNAMPTI